MTDAEGWDWIGYRLAFGYWLCGGEDAWARGAPEND